MNEMQATTKSRPNKNSKIGAINRVIAISIIIAPIMLSIIPQNGYATKITSGRQTATAGTAVQLSTTSTFCKEVIITAEESNTDIVAVGSSSVDATEATRNGTVLFAGQTLVLTVRNLVSVYIDTEVSSEGVSWNCVA